ncbi:MAG: hypothetical protein V1777_04210 [Candidatus Micrarchaeota archaeon]
MVDLKARFLGLYANLPLNIRKEVILVLGNEPVSWNVAFLEINAGTKKGGEILKKLEELKIL